MEVGEPVHRPPSTRCAMVIRIVLLVLLAVFCVGWWLIEQVPDPAAVLPP